MQYKNATGIKVSTAQNVTVRFHTKEIIANRCIVLAEDLNYQNIHVRAFLDSKDRIVRILCVQV